MNLKQLKNWIKQCEGLRLTPYQDSKGYWTIGYGHCLEFGDIPLSVAELLFADDFNNIILELSGCSWFVSQPANVKCALINMGFQLGLTNLLEFVDMIKALNKKDYAMAAKEALDSQWARNFPDRANEVASMIRKGV